MEDSRRLRLEALFSEHAAAVRAYVLRRSDPAGADDVVMEVFVIACRRLDELPAQPLPWLLGCARRVLANQRRGSRRAQALVEKLSVSLADRETAGDIGEALFAALNTLSERDREVLLLSAWEGLDPSEVAQVLGCSRPAAAVRLHRARRRLRAAMSPGGEMETTTTAAEVLR